MYDFIISKWPKMFLHFTQSLNIDIVIGWMDILWFHLWVSCKRNTVNVSNAWWHWYTDSECNCVSMYHSFNLNQVKPTCRIEFQAKYLVLQQCIEIVQKHWTDLTVKYDRSAGFFYWIRVSEYGKTILCEARFKVGS